MSVRQTLIACSIALAQIRFRGVGVIKPRSKFFVSAADVKAVAIIVWSVDIMAVDQLDLLFAIAG